MNKAQGTGIKKDPACTWVSHRIRIIRRKFAACLHGVELGLGVLGFLFKKCLTHLVYGKGPCKGVEIASFHKVIYVEHKAGETIEVCAS